MSSQIDILPSHKINKIKWDNCITNSDNGLIYASTIYLDNIADNWHGIIVNDYDCVMPIAWRKKYGFRYCYDVPFMQQLGWFPSQINDVFLTKALFRFCKYGDYNFNYANNVALKNFYQHNNFIINLKQSYNVIKNKYKPDIINNLKKTANQQLIYVDETIEAAIYLFKNLYSRKLPQISEKEYDNFYQLCKFFLQTDLVFARKVCTHHNETLAAALFLKDKKRIYNLMNSTTEAGRKTEANHFLFDCVFKEFAESGLIFDFEGSDIAGIKNFYEKFGAVNQPYYKIHFNKLPFPINFLKR
ncbi:MAG: hypothetical protein ACR2FN_02535 [Chitinophagaceae bacterium]